jgi:hypothetical protein
VTSLVQSLAPARLERRFLRRRAKHRETRAESHERSCASHRFVSRPGVGRKRVFQGLGGLLSDEGHRAGGGRARIRGHGHAGANAPRNSILIDPPRPGAPGQGARKVAGIRELGIPDLTVALLVLLPIVLAPVARLFAAAMGLGDLLQPCSRVILPALYCL